MGPRCWAWGHGWPCPGPGRCEGSQRPLGSALALREFSAPPDFGQKCPSLAGSLPPAPGSYVAEMTACLVLMWGLQPRSAVHTPEQTWQHFVPGEAFPRTAAAAQGLCLLWT